MTRVIGNTPPPVPPRKLDEPRSFDEIAAEARAWLAKHGRSYPLGAFNGSDEEADALEAAAETRELYGESYGEPDLVGAPW